MTLLAQRITYREIDKAKLLTHLLLDTYEKNTQYAISFNNNSCHEFYHVALDNTSLICQNWFVGCSSSDEKVIFFKHNRKSALPIYLRVRIIEHNLKDKKFKITCVVVNPAKDHQSDPHAYLTKKQKLSWDSSLRTTFVFNIFYR